MSGSAELEDLPETMSEEVEGERVAKITIPPEETIPELELVCLVLHASSDR